MRAVVGLVALLALSSLCLAAYNPNKNEAPIWKVFCDTLYGGRLDPIVNPGTYSGHVHRVFGGSNFSPSTKTRTPVEQYDITKASPCTSCSIRDVDNSQYWTADLYYRWPNNTYSLVPSGGLTVYYLSRGGSTGENKTNPNWQPIPKGLRIVAGDPTRRTYDPNNVAHQAIDYVCLNYAGGGFPQSEDWNGLKNYKCPNGLRTQVFFPMCWDGKNLDSPDHRSHMSYPVQRPNGGDCPSSHPVRIPGVFFEHTFNVGDFPHGNGENNFLWSMGDPTGYGHHGDFLSGWDEEVVRQAIAHPACSNENPDMNFGNTVTACPPLAPYVKQGAKNCDFVTTPVPLTENLGLSRPIKRIPGCYTYNGQLPASQCNRSPLGSDNEGTYFIYSNGTQNFLGGKKDAFVTTNQTKDATTYSELWSFRYVDGTLVNIQNQENQKVISARDKAQLNGGSGSWEQWTIVYLSDLKNQVAFKSNRDGKSWLTADANGTLVIKAGDVTTASTFTLFGNNGGHIPGDVSDYGSVIATSALSEVSTGGAAGSVVLSVALSFALTFVF
ncbi:hypothetical protein PROFUN_14801 [Planoprotostelium fungivorum]|uniref:DUF1996 domain-containing protein n=1 Tax=Planoprotostelium fungivorum TaxID=1890364 RepID=A0A2P6MYQ8_9EUKA|nr:hypothetical protein PROFUN_14801 [Planoprotostelium fungivorum]